MNPTPEQQTEQALDIFVEPSSKVGALTLRPFSAGTLTLCRKLGLSMIVGGADEKAAITEDDKQRQITTFIFIQSAPLEDVLRGVKLARKDREAFDDEILLPFELTLPVSAIIEAVEQMVAGIDQIGYSQFDTVPKDETSGKPEMPPPNS